MIFFSPELTLCVLCILYDLKILENIWNPCEFESIEQRSFALIVSISGRVFEKQLITHLILRNCEILNVNFDNFHRLLISHNVFVCFLA